MVRTIVLAGALAICAAAPQTFAPPLPELLRLAEESIQSGEFARAEGLLEQVVRRDSSNTEARYRLGYVQYRQRKLLAARLSFAAAVRLAPPAYHSRYFLGRIALLENKPKEAVSWLEPVVQAGETAFDAASQLASAYLAAGDPRKAISPLKAAIAAAPWDGALYYRLGQLHKQLEESELAKEAFDTSARLKSANREDVQALMQVGQLMGEGKQAEALQVGAGISERGDSDPNALVALGVIYGNAKLPAEAVTVFERAAKLDPRFFQAQFNYGLALLKAGSTAEAIAPLTRAHELLPQSQEAALTLGLAAVMMRRYEEAIPPLERAWKKDASNPKLGALLGTAYLRSGAAAKAVPVLRAASADGKDPAPVLLLVEALAASEQPDAALATAQLARKHFPKLPQAHLAAAQQLARAGRYQEARPAFAEAAALAPGLAEAELGLADALQKAGEHTAAVEHFRAAGALPPARIGLARSLIALKRLDEARTVLEGALPANPDDITLRLELARLYTRAGETSLAEEQTRMIEQLRSKAR